MGPKVTIDSATLMNKGLEVIEAHHLFGVAARQRSPYPSTPRASFTPLVEFVDGSLKAQLGRPDMRLPIAVALAYPDRLPDAVPPAPHRGAVSGLEFHALDEKRFPERRAGPRRRPRPARAGPAVLNAANEEAVNAFLAGRARLQRDRPDRWSGPWTPSRAAGRPCDEILEADRWARDYLRTKSGRLRA